MIGTHADWFLIDSVLGTFINISPEEDIVRGTFIYKWREGLKGIYILALKDKIRLPLRSVSKRKAAGTDNIAPECLQATEKELIKIRINVCQQVCKSTQ